MSAASPPEVFMLDAPAASELSLAGGKAVGLHALFALELPVPPGFCISAAAFRAALAGAGPELASLIAGADALEPSDTAAVGRYAARVREAVLALPLSPALEEAVLRHWKMELRGAPVAVRSSATAEDLEESSFAGQQDTVLDVRDAGALLQAIRQCWASLFNDRALSYRLNLGVSSASAAMGVVVQRMVDAERAGLLFTADPATGHRGVFTVEAVEGLGEALVSGHALPDRWRLSKHDGTVLEAHLGADRTTPLLSEEQLKALWRLGLRVDEGRGTPQDIEWAVAEGRAWLLQSRAITTLNPLPQPRPAQTAGGRTPFRIYVSFGHIQMNTAPLSPLAHSVVRRLVPFERDPATHVSSLVVEMGQRMYVDATRALATKGLGPRLARALQSMSPQIADRLETALDRPELAQVARAGGAISRAAILRRLVPVILRMVGNVVRPTRRMVDRYIGLLESLVASQRAQVEAAAGADRLRAVEAVIVGTFERLLFQIGAPLIPLMFMGDKLLRKWTKRYAPALPEDVLQRGLEGNIVTEMDLALGDLADLARPVPALQEALRSGDPAAQVLALRGAADTGLFFRAWDAFLDQSGHRGAGEIDVAVPRWREDPSAPLRSVAGFLDRPEGAHRQHQVAARAQAEAALAEIVAGARRGLLGWLRAPLIERTARKVRVFLALREHHKEAVMRTLYLARRECLAAGARLAGAGALDRKEDVWMLGLPELTGAVARVDRGEEAPGLRERVATRAREQERWRRWSPPPVLTSEGEALRPRAAKSVPKGTWVGTGVSSGVVEGLARVVEDPARATLAPGEVLVAPFTDPGWTPLFMHAAGLVMEVGGTMTHGSVIARELGIPAVVAVEGATRALRTGQRVRVDGDRGWVTLLDEAPPVEAP